MKMRFAVAVLVCWSAAAFAAEAPPLHVSGGWISGTVQDVSGTEVRAYLGVPFAAPPVGQLRWCPPEPVAPWEDVRKCTEFPAACPQQPDRLYANRFEKQSEDCLYLNVWTAAAVGERRPVMVWIHGGGNLIGGTATPIYDGRRLAAAGVVIVTIQYRLGAFGYLAHPALTEESKTKFGRASSGNYGLMDQVAALRWVAANILKFGGDPACVTVFGESAGAANITHLMASPLAKGLFHRAIAESGYFGERTAFLTKAAGRISSAHDQGLDFAKRVGVAGNDARALAELRAVSVEKILAVPMTIGGGGLSADGKMQLGPIVDGYVLPEPPRDVWASGHMHRVPLIVGSNLDDGSVFSQNNPIKRKAGYEVATAMLFGVDGSRRIREIFPVAKDADVPKAVHQLITAIAFRAPARRLAHWMELAGGQSWLYLFSHNPGQGRAAQWGVFHGLEIPYVFGNSPSFGAAGGAVNPGDQAVSNEMMRRWTAFAKFGDPNGGKADPAWPAYRKADDKHLEFGDKPIVGQGLDRKACDLLDELSDAKQASR